MLTGARCRLRLDVRGGMPDRCSLSFLRCRRKLLCAKQCTTHCRWIVAQLHIQQAIRGMRHRQCIAWESIRYLDGVLELRVTRDGIHKEQTVARELARQLGRRRTLEILQLWQ